MRHDFSEKAHWICKEGHTFTATRAKLLARKYPCLSCSKTTAPVKFQEIVKRNSDFVAYPVKGLKALDGFFEGSNTIVEWICSKEHVFERRIQTHFFLQARCPRCSTSSQSSILEKEMQSLICDETLGKVELNYRESNLELDVYLSSLKLGIEFNGDYWHSSKMGEKVIIRDKRKREHFESTGITIYVVWEHDWIHHRQTVENDLRNIINGRKIESDFLKINLSVFDTKRKCCEKAQQLYTSKNNPDLRKERVKQISYKLYEKRCLECRSAFKTSLKRMKYCTPKCGVKFRRGSTKS